MMEDIMNKKEDPSGSEEMTEWFKQESRRYRMICTLGTYLMIAGAFCGAVSFLLMPSSVLDVVVGLLCMVVFMTLVISIIKYRKKEKNK